MLQPEPYVDENGNTYEPKNKKKRFFTFLSLLAFLLLIIFVIIFLIVSTTNSSKKRKCKNLEEILSESASKYAKANELLPTINGTSITFSTSELIEKGFLKESDFSLKEKKCGGTAKLTKVDDQYLATVDITDCNYCTTSTRYGDWSKESNKKPSSGVIDVITYYNYVEKSTYYTSWTNYYTLEEIERNPITEVTDRRFPTISSDAKNIEIEVDNLMYYRYRDKQWKYYKENGGSYTNYFSSEQPNGYANKDPNTLRQTEYTQWSLNYPEKKEYRSIRDTQGYRWYYMEGKEKNYWNSGAYYPTQPDEKYTEKEKEAVRMYSYSDKEYRWYNGVRRSYSSYTSNMPNGYTNRDNDLTRYTGWSSWLTSSKVDDSNRSYREEETENRPRYRLKYDMYSFNKLNESLTKEEFESNVGKTLQEIIDDPKLDLIVTYKYKSKK